MSEKTGLIFADKFAEICDVLDVRYRAMSKTDPNNADKGELCEIFIRDALAEIVAGTLCIFRGGKIVDSHNRRSRQIDIIVCWRSALRIFADKGLYPTEMVCGAIAITSTLDRIKLAEDINGLASIPVGNLAFSPISLQLADRPDLLKEVVEQWKRISPYRCIFAFDGNLNEGWMDVLNNPVNLGKVELEQMPELVVVNKKGMFVRKIQANLDGTPATPENQDRPNDHYRYMPFIPDGPDAVRHYYPIAMILCALNQLSVLQNHLAPDYSKYFVSEMDLLEGVRRQQ